MRELGFDALELGWPGGVVLDDVDLEWGHGALVERRLRTSVGLS